MTKVNVFIRRFVFIASACVLLCFSSHAMEKNERGQGLLKIKAKNHAYYTINDAVCYNGKTLYEIFSNNCEFCINVFKYYDCNPNYFFYGYTFSGDRLFTNQLNNMFLFNDKKYAIIEVKINEKCNNTYCRYYWNIESIDVEDNIIKGLFFDQEDILSIKIIANDTGNVINMCNMFAFCQNLKSLDLGNLNTSYVTNMSGMFYSCSSLTKLDVSKMKTDKVINMSCMFSGCINLKELNLSNFNTGNVIVMCNMFSECISLKFLDLSNFNTKNVTYMGGMFRECKSLSEIRCSWSLMNSMKKFIRENSSELGLKDYKNFLMSLNCKKGEIYGINFDKKSCIDTINVLSSIDEDLPEDLY